ALESGTVADAVRLDVSSPGAILEGRIVDEDGRPPAVARVHVFSDDGGEQTPLSGIAVREDGSYRVVGLDPGPHRLVVALRREGPAPASESGPFVAEDVVLEAGRTTERHDRLAPDRELTVEVTWTEKGPKDPPP